MSLFTRGSKVDQMGRRHDIQHSDTQHNDTQHNDIQHNKSVIMLSVFYA
jgi:hypothetical protein